MFETKNEKVFKNELKKFKGREVTDTETLTAWNAFSKSRTWMYVRGMKNTPDFSAKSFQKFFTEHTEAAIKYKQPTI